MDKILKVAKEAALKAGRYAKEEQKNHLNLNQKDDGSWATHVDEGAEKIIREIIIKNFPDHDIYGEEYGHENTGSDYIWYVDPIDGTHNYMKGLPFYGVSIGVYKNDEGIVGVIYIPEFDELYYASKGQGAFLNDKKIDLSKKNDDKLTISFELMGNKKEELVEKYLKYLVLNFSFRKFGSSVFDIAMVAKGSLSCHMGFDLKPYDVAAGIIIVNEANGKISTLENKTDNLLFERDVITCANKKVHKKLVRL